jgi:hypothetical protein
LGESVWNGTPDDEAVIRGLSELNEKLALARSLLLPVSEEFARTRQRKFQVHFNGQPIVGESAHEAGVVLGYVLFIGSWGAGDLRGLANSFLGRKSPWQTAQKIDKEVVSRRLDKIFCFLESVNPPPTKGLIEAMRVEVQEAARNRHEVLSQTLIPQEKPLAGPDEEEEQFSELREAWFGANRLLHSLTTLSGQVNRKQTVNRKLDDRIELVVVLPMIFSWLAENNESCAGPIVLVQTRLAEARKRKGIKVVGRDRETAAAAIVALALSFNRICRNCGVIKCKNAAESLVPGVLIQSLGQDGDRKFPRLLESVVKGSLYAREFPRQFGGIEEKYSGMKDWHSILLASEQFQRTLAEIDAERLFRESSEALDFDSDFLKAELILEFSDLLASEQENPVPEVFQSFPPKQQKLLQVLWGKEKVSIQKILRAVYGPRSPSMEALEKLKDRTNSRLAQAGLLWEIKQQGNTFELVSVERGQK